MSTYRANLWSSLAGAYIATVGALPDDGLACLEYLLLLNIGQENLVTLLMLLLNGTNSLKELGNLLKAFLTGNLGKLRVHGGPLVVLSLSSSLQVLLSSAYAIMDELVPDLGMLLLILGSLLEDVLNLHIAVLLGLGCKILILGMSLGLTSKCSHEVFQSLSTLQIHKKFLPFFTRLLLMLMEKS